MDARCLSVTMLVIATMLTTSCIEYPQQEPKAADLEGRYVPADLSDGRIHADSELVLGSDGSCKLKDFPLISYSFVRPPAPDLGYVRSLLEFPREGDVCYSTSKGTWRLQDNITMVIDLQNHGEIQLNILNGSSPYRIAQGLAKVDDYSMFFDKAKQ
jgi:hypothetical protein